MQEVASHSQRTLEPFVTRIKMKSRDQHVNVYYINQAIKECFKEAI